VPSVVDESGLSVPEGGRPDMTAEQISRAVDLIIVRLRAQRYKYREIGAILNRPPETIRTKFRRIPQNARRHYASASMG
jgi:IS30 family transposase